MSVEHYNCSILLYLFVARIIISFISSLNTEPWGIIKNSDEKAKRKVSDQKSYRYSVKLILFLKALQNVGENK